MQSDRQRQPIIPLLSDNMNYPIVMRVCEFKISLTRQQKEAIDKHLETATWLWNKGLELLRWTEYHSFLKQCQFYPKESFKEQDVKLPEKILTDWGFVDIKLANIRKHRVEPDSKANTKKKTKKKQKDNGTPKVEDKVKAIYCLASDRTQCEKISINKYKTSIESGNYIKQVLSDDTTIYSGLPELKPGQFIVQSTTKQGDKLYLHSVKIEEKQQYWASKPPIGEKPSGNALGGYFTKERVKNFKCFESFNDPEFRTQFESITESIKTQWIAFPSAYIAGVCNSLATAWDGYIKHTRGIPKFKSSKNNPITALIDNNNAEREKKTEEDKALEKEARENHKKLQQEAKAKGEKIGKFIPDKKPLTKSNFKIKGNKAFLPIIGEIYCKGLAKRWGNRLVVNHKVIKEPSGYYLQLTGEFNTVSKLKQYRLKGDDGNLKAVGIDAGVVSLFVDDKGRMHKPKAYHGSEIKKLYEQGEDLEKIKRLEKINRRYLIEERRKVRLQKKMKKQVFGSKNYQKTKLAKAKLEEKARRRSLASDHKFTTRLVREYDGIVCEALNIKNMTKRSKTQLTEDGTDYKKVNRKQKSGLNKAILRNTHGRRMEMLAKKTEALNTICQSSVREFTKVDPKHSSQECRVCGHIDEGNRPTQESFKCLKCGHSEHADVNAARNILKRGLESFVRRYRSWGWEFKPVDRETYLSVGDVPTGDDVDTASMRQEAAESVADSGTTAPQSEIWITTTATNSDQKEDKGKKTTCDNQEMLKTATVKNRVKTLPVKGIDTLSFNQQVGAISEALIEKPFQEIKPAAKRKGQTRKSKKTPNVSQNESVIQLELDLWNTAPEINSESE
ncbi:zinc ribbon domain-containing protein [Planktothrix sp.]|uniref:zinc ribbon domain-containing protein n=3 Tax=Planktothrix sp. TaxID=3088171 RepID=UPI0038D3BEDF